MDAAEISGMNVLRLMNESTAASLAFGFGNKSYNDKNILIFNLGGDL